MINQNLEVLLRELLARSQEMEEETKNFFQELDVSSEEIDAYISDPANFSQESWSHIQEQKKTLEELSERSLKNRRDPRKTKKSFDELHIPPHWLFVR